MLGGATGCALARRPTNAGAPEGTEHCDFPMKLRWRFFLMFCLLVATGCRNNAQLRTYIESHNAENRLLEDEIYALEHENDLLRLRLERETQRGGDSSPSGETTPRGSTPGRRRGPSTKKPEDDLKPPEIEEGSATPPQKTETPDASPGPGGKSPARDNPSGKPPRFGAPEKPAAPGVGDIDPNPEMPDDPAPKTRPAIRAKPPTIPPAELPAPKPTTEPEVIDKTVTHLFLNPLHTGGADLDNQPGDDGLSILLEPRNAEDQFVPLTGKVSIVVLDPSQSGEASRLARWDFAEDDLRDKIKKSTPRGFHLQMAWPTKPPANTALRLFVRYETADGRKLKADQELFIQPAGQVSSRWTPRPPERRDHHQATAKLAGQTREKRPASTAPDLAPAAESPASLEPEPDHEPGLLQPPIKKERSPAATSEGRPQWKPFR